MLPETLDLLRCPRTGSRLTLDDAGSLRSEVAGHTYAVMAGIPDFRLTDPPYATRAEERKRVEEILTAGSSMKYEDLVVHYESKILRHQTARETTKNIEHRLALRGRAKRRFRELVDQVGYRTPPASAEAEHLRVLDLGCGSGEAISEIGRFGDVAVFGIDISMEELVLARVLLREEGANAVLVAGGAEALPFADDLFAFIYSPDVIEHVIDQRAYLREAHRVLAPGGSLLFNSPNRFSLVAPEPHNGVWGFGFLPRAAMDRASRMLGRGEYVGKRLVSLYELRKLSAAQFRDYAVHSRASNPRATSLGGRLFHWTSPFSVRLFAYFAELHVVLARKEQRGS